jgi:hypothetical protein
VNRRAADAWVARMTATSLRGMADRLSIRQCPEETTEAGLAKYKEACIRLADKLAAKLPKEQTHEQEG